MCIHDKSSGLVSHFQNGADFSDLTAGGRAAGPKLARGRRVSAAVAPCNKKISTGPSTLQIEWKGAPGRGLPPVKSWAP